MSGLNKNNDPEALHRLALQTMVMAALHQSFAEHGIEAIERCRKEAPVEYLRIVTQLLPADVEAALRTIQAIDTAKRSKP